MEEAVTTLITSDLHFTDKPRDAYRFKLFPWIEEQVVKHKVDYVLVLGDLTDAKDRHSAALVNQIVDHTASLSKKARTFFLRGNHDGLDPDHPFFRFFNQMPFLAFIVQPEQVKLANFSDAKTADVLFLPHSRDTKKDWHGINMSRFDYVFLHQTLKGALSENGMVLDGIAASAFKEVKRAAFSGDIHVPQRIGPVEYVGSPYHVHFGDSFEPRVVLLKEGEGRNLRFPAVRKHALRLRVPEDIAKHTELRKGDQVKVKLVLRRSEFSDWLALRRRVVDICQRLGLDLHGVEVEELKRKQLQGEQSIPAPLPSARPQDAFARYCQRERIEEDLAKAGLAFLDDGQHALHSPSD